MSKRQQYTPQPDDLDEEMDKRLDALAAAKNVPRLVSADESLSPARPRVDEKAPTRRVWFDLPEDLAKQLDRMCYEEGATARYFVMKAFHDSGLLEVPEYLLVKDRRKRR